VNLHFLSSHYGCSPDEVVKIKARGKGFVSLHEAVKKCKGKPAPKIKGERRQKVKAVMKHKNASKKSGKKGKK
jgi:hypothetical protein